MYRRMLIRAVALCLGLAASASCDRSPRERTLRLPPGVAMPSAAKPSAPELPPEPSRLEERVAQLREVASRRSSGVRLRSFRVACVTHMGEISIACGDTSSGQTVYGATELTSWAIVSAEFERAGPEVLGLTWMGGAITRQVLTAESVTTSDGPRCSFRNVMMRAADFGTAPFTASYEGPVQAGTPGLWRLSRNGIEHRVPDDCPDRRPSALLVARRLPRG